MKSVRSAAFALLALAAASPALAISPEASEAAEKFAGLPVEIWKTVNLLLILSFLVYFLQGPMRKFFRDRRDGVNERIRRAAADRDGALQLAADMQARLAKLESEIAAVREQGIRDGEEQKREHLSIAEREVDELRRVSLEEIDRHLAMARAELAKEARNLAAATAKDVVAAAVSGEDRKRLFEESVRGLENAR